MLLPCKSLGEIGRFLSNFDRTKYYEKSTTFAEFEDFKLHCLAWEERTGNAVTFKEMGMLLEVYP